MADENPAETHKQMNMLERLVMYFAVRIVSATSLFGAEIKCMQVSDVGELSRGHARARRSGPSRVKGASLSSNLVRVLDYWCVDQRFRLSFSVRDCEISAYAKLSGLTGCGKMRVDERNFLSVWPVQGCWA